MPADSKLIDRARDELFSHINRCGVLNATDEDKVHWMDETIEYLGERYPDLTTAALRDLHAVGMRFCQPAIPHGTRSSDAVEEPVDATPSLEMDGSENTEDEKVDANAA